MLRSSPSGPRIRFTTSPAMYPSPGPRRHSNDARSVKPTRVHPATESNRNVATLQAEADERCRVVLYPIAEAVIGRINQIIRKAISGQTFVVLENESPNHFRDDRTPSLRKLVANATFCHHRPNANTVLPDACRTRFDATQRSRGANHALDTRRRRQWDTSRVSRQ